ncbi:MAG: HD domain-containing protein [Paracoccaceae bacterium]
MQRLTDVYDYAARMHRDQRRNGALAEPYVNHVIEVAARVARSPQADEVTVLGALLHDIVEDTTGTAEDIAARFGADVAALVMEVTDDKGLEKAERKLRQELSSPGKSDRAKRIKLADKAANVTALTDSPPADWDIGRKRAYVDWAERVIAGCRGVDAVLETGFDAAVARARAALA